MDRARLASHNELKHSGGYGRHHRTHDPSKGFRTVFLPVAADVRAVECLREEKFGRNVRRQRGGDDAAQSGGGTNLFLD